MRMILTLLPVLFLAACATTMKPDTGPYASMDCAALEAERVKLVAELDGLPASDSDRIDKTRAAIEAVGSVQVQKGCAG